MEQLSKKVTSTILSMSLLTVMAGAAIAPALGIIKQHFAGEPQLLVQFIVSIPALFIIITNLFFLTISRHFKTRAIALTGLVLYVVAGAGCFFAQSIYAILVLRALLGISVGLIMPLSTGLLAYYYPPEEQARHGAVRIADNRNAAFPCCFWRRRNWRLQNWHDYMPYLPLSGLEHPPLPEFASGVRICFFRL